jgi:hypothetical protein
MQRFFIDRKILISADTTVSAWVSQAGFKVVPNSNKTFSFLEKLRSWVYPEL